mmetsp:Transcript_4605/g.7011  ORF Transcript_4605/g.7011 Transcript_4605/m.7011 type:complete len:142 (-) Transcript_4605:48-473(-)
MFSFFKASRNVILQHSTRRSVRNYYQHRLYTTTQGCGSFLGDGNGGIIHNQTTTTTTLAHDHHHSSSLHDSILPAQWSQNVVVGGTTSFFGVNSLNQIVSQTWDSFQDGIFRMSSTLKKRRAKMNKHKLRKRRKKMRLKSK